MKNKINIIKNDLLYLKSNKNGFEMFSYIKVFYSNNDLIDVENNTYRNANEIMSSANINLGLDASLLYGNELLEMLA